jgi:Protein of unknown function (DUF998)
MTAALGGVGVCHTVTAAGLGTVAVPGRLLLATGGTATVLLAAFPQPVTGDSTVHVVAASVAFSALSLWPALACRRYGRPRSVLMLVVATGLLGLLGWFGVEYFGQRTRIGLSERVLAAAQALWPFAAVLLSRCR